MAGLSSLTYTESVGLNWTAQNNITGTDYNPITNSGSINKKVALGTSVGNAVAGGSDELYSAISTITGAGAVNLNLQALTDILNTANVNLQRVKAITVRLLSTADDATNGTTCTSVRIDGSVANALLGATTGWISINTGTFDIPLGGIMTFGTGNAPGVAVSNTSRVVRVINNDATNSAAVQVTIVGGST